MCLRLHHDKNEIYCDLYYYDINIINYLGLKHNSVKIQNDINKSLNNNSNKNNLVYKNLQKVLTVLKSNETYRFGDVINNNVHLINAIIGNPDTYKGSLLYEYIVRLKSENLLRFCKKKKKYSIASTTTLIMRYRTLARSCMKFKRKEIPCCDTLVVHLRTGDIVANKTHAYYTDPVEIYKLINTYINNQNGKIKRIVLITALHYGVAHEGITHYRKTLSNKHPFAYTRESERLNHVYIEEIVKNCTLPVLIKSEGDIDNSLIFMAYAKHFINTKGNFSKCLRNLNSLIKNMTTTEKKEDISINSIE